MNPIESTILVEEVYRRIKFMILEGEIARGERIDRKTLAAVLGVSLTPVNEATARLVGERFIERRVGPRKEDEGLFVPERPEDELVHVFAVRAGLEGIAAMLCVERISAGASPHLFERICNYFSSFSPPFDETRTAAYLAEDKLFHEGIMQYAANPVLTDLDSNLGCVHRSWIKGLIRPPEETLPEHQAIIAAFRARDAMTAGRLLSEHNLKSRAVLMERLGSRKKTSAV